MKWIKCFEEYKVDNFTEQDIIDTIENNGSIKVSSIKNLPAHNSDDYIKPVDIDGDSIIVDIDGQQYRTYLKFVTTLEYSPLNESVITDEEKEELLDDAMGYTERSDAIGDVNYLRNYYDKIPNVITLNRVVFLDHKEDLNSEQLGEHWVEEKIDDDFVGRIRETTDQHGEPYIIVARFKKSDVDFYNTLHNNMNFPNEMEVTIKRHNVAPIEYNLYTYEDYQKI